MEEKAYNDLLQKVKSYSTRVSFLFNKDYIQTIYKRNNHLSIISKTKQLTFFSRDKNKLTPEQILKNIFGYTSFRPLQREIIDNILNRHDTLAIMPTGGGKSLCYQIPALVMDGLTVVISPLIALMEDQVSQLLELGVSAVYLNSSLDWDSYKNTLARIKNGEIKILYVSPEGLNTQRIQELLHSEEVELNLLTVDEAHCVSEWGHDFRPDYMEIASIREQFPNTVCLALTATATDQVRTDIIKMLQLRKPSILIASFNRPNIFLDVERKNKPIEQVIRLLQEHSGQSGIIYCFSRKQVDQLTQVLLNAKFNVTNYHAGLSDIERSEHQRSFIYGKIDIIIATVAFGMGVNKPDVRFVIHYDLPKSIEQYYQEIGRAGRDGLEADAILLYSPADVHKIRYFFDESADANNAERLLKSMVNFAECHSCRRKYLLNYFGETYIQIDEKEKTVAQNDIVDKDSIYNTKEYCCDICNQMDNKTDVTIASQKLLSCILRTDERYGATYIIDILLGSKQQRILDNGHDSLSTWGIGKELDKNDWFELVNCLVDQNYLFKSEEYNVLSLSEKGHNALRNRESFLLNVRFLGKVTKIETLQKPIKVRKQISTTQDGNFEYVSSLQKKPRKNSKRKSSLEILMNTSDKETIHLIDSLKKWRKHYAEEINVPPYVIFGDKTLADIAEKKPISKDELLDCHGIGEMKVEKFGDSILNIINQI